MLRKIRSLFQKQSGGSSKKRWGGIEGNPSTLQATKDLEKLESQGRGMKARFRASNMAAGPCETAAQIDNALFDPKNAPLPPFADCPHPDQCACMYQAHFNVDDL